MTQMSTDELEALTRLLKHALSDTGQSRRVANFLLAWWNATNCGGFDIADTWALDDEIVDDVITVFRLATRGNYPDTLGFGPRFEEVVALWRPDLSPTV
ncbi:hypothetical protein DBB29_00755 [Pandoraea cepalis]|uniref:DUF7673 domain-containing protein n=1 Tax=Pandoraea cepalis TaxID=2508294 RepID=A0AAW7MGZ1_9BURK|nr:hypothetical protein [Pandoraea cepalis]MDN4572012.1 hypothetical protein [Pandoraea cepalis]MDN4576663.1 hypothetical protein [Pandoraea cepalis]